MRWCTDVMDVSDLVELSGLHTLIYFNILRNGLFPVNI